VTAIGRLGASPRLDGARSEAKESTKTPHQCEDPMKDALQERIEAGRFIAFLRHLRDVDSQAELSRMTGIPRTEINRYEKGKQKPLPATFEKIRSKLGIPPRLVAFLRWCHNLMLRSEALADRLEAVPPSEPRLPEEARAVVCEIVERALAMARAEHALVRDESPDHAKPG
jgi:transcriptional regulator with XRE-family HTH domain